MVASELPCTNINFPIGIHITWTYDSRTNSYSYRIWRLSYRILHLSYRILHLSDTQHKVLIILVRSDCTSTRYVWTSTVVSYTSYNSMSTEITAFIFDHSLTGGLSPRSRVRRISENSRNQLYNALYDDTSPDVESVKAPSCENR